MANPLHNSGDIPQNAAHTRIYSYTHTHTIQNNLAHYTQIHTHYKKNRCTLSTGKWGMLMQQKKKLVMESARLCMNFEILYPACLNLLLVNIFHGRCSRPLPCVYKKSSLELQDGSSPEQSPSTLQRILKPSPYMHFARSHSTCTLSQNTHTHTHAAILCARMWVEGEGEQRSERKRERKREEKP